MHIGVDLDNTVLDATEAFFRYFNKISGRSLTHVDATEFNLYRLYGWDKTKYEKIYGQLGHDIHWDSSPYPMAIDTLHDLYKSHRLTIITARPDLFREVTLQWLEHHKVPHHNLVFSESKLQACMDLEIEVLIDDGPHYAKEFSKHKRPVIMLEHPYNRIVTDDFIYHASNWTMVKSHIDYLLQTAKGMNV